MLRGAAGPAEVAVAAMMQRLDRGWRLVGTGLGFALFGLGGLLLRVLVFPAQRWVAPQGAPRRQTLARATIGLAFRLFVRVLSRLGVLHYEILGAERLGRPGQLVLANHPSLLDVVLLLGVPSMKHAGCIVKESLWHNVFTRGPVRAAGYISNDASLATLDDAVAQLRSGQSLLIFPEGTRTTPGQLPVFHRGACAIALRGAAVLTPVHIRVTPTSLTKNEPWYRIPAQKVCFHIEVGEDLDPAAWLAGTSMPLAARRLNTHLHHLFCPSSRHDHAGTRTSDQTVHHRFPGP